MSTITTTTIAVQTAIPDPPARRVTIHARPRSTALARYRDPRPPAVAAGLTSRQAAELQRIRARRGRITWRQEGDGRLLVAVHGDRPAVVRRAAVSRSCAPTARSRSPSGRRRRDRPVTSDEQRSPASRAAAHRPRRRRARARARAPRRRADGRAATQRRGRRRDRPRRRPRARVAERPRRASRARRRRAPVEVDRRTALTWHDAAWRAARAGTIPVGDARRIGEQLRGRTPAA